jgi:hexosaminidase
LNEITTGHVLGIQADLWTEHMQTEDRVQRMAWPRAAAVAELGWSAPERRNWPDFLRRLVPLFGRYSALGLVYADSVYAVAARISPSADGTTVILSNQALSGEIRYTLDGSDPTPSSALYAAPLTLPPGTEIRAATFVQSVQASQVWVRRLDARNLVRRNSHDLELCTNGVGLLLEPGTGTASLGAPLAIDIMNPCWIDRGVDLTRGPAISAAVVPLPFNFELGADVANIRVGDARTPDGELEIHIDGCDTPAVATLPLAKAAAFSAVTRLPTTTLPSQAGRHDLCLRFARPRLDPMWALDWIEIGE